MTKNYGNEEEYTGSGRVSRLSPSEEEASAQKIIEDYLKQVKNRLPPALAAEVIPELRSHLFEQATDPTGRMTTSTAWDAVVAMGSPDIVAREFRRDSEFREETETPKGFIEALKPFYRTWFWRIVVIIAIVDLVFIAFIVTVIIGWALIGNYFVVLNGISIAIQGQVWVFAGIAVTYLVMLLLSHPQGFPLSELLQRILEKGDHRERRVPRTQRRVQKRVKKFEKYTGRRHLFGELAGNIIAGVIFIIFVVVLLALFPTYPILDIQTLIWLAIICLSQAGLTTLRIIVGSDSLPLARLLASFNALYTLVGIQVITLFFFGPLLFPFPYWDPNLQTFTLFHWKPYMMMFQWIGPLIILIMVVVMVLEIIQANIYIQPLYNGNTAHIPGETEQPIHH